MNHTSNIAIPTEYGRILEKPLGELELIVLDAIEDIYVNRQIPYYRSEGLIHAAIERRRFLTLVENGSIYMWGYAHEGFAIEKQLELADPQFVLADFVIGAIQAFAAAVREKSLC